MRIDAEEILKLVLTRLDDMKAEDTLTIDLRDKSSIGDYMVVSSGRSQRHVGSVADWVVEDLHKAGVRAHVEGTPHYAGGNHSTSRRRRAYIFNYEPVTPG